MHGELPDAGRPVAALLADIEDSGLRGRGGAAFPTAVKAMAVAGRRRPVIVVNGSEGEPMSAKDRVLLDHAPHLIVDGVVVAAAATGGARGDPGGAGLLPPPSGARDRRAARGADSP